MKVEYTITEDEYVKANKLFTRPSKNNLVFYTAVAISLILLSIAADSVAVKIGAIGGIVGGFIGHMVVRHIYAPWKTRRQYRTYQAAREPITVQVRPESLFFKSKIGEAIIEWPRINNWCEDEQFLLIYQAPEVYHILPKRAGEAINNVREALVLIRNSGQYPVMLNNL